MTRPNVPAGGAEGSSAEACQVSASVHPTGRPNVLLRGLGDPRRLIPLPRSEGGGTRSTQAADHSKGDGVVA